MDNFFKQVNPWLQMAGNAIGNVAKAGYGLDEKELGNLGGNIADAAHAGANGLGWVFKQPLASPQDDPNATNTNQSYNIDQYGSPMTHQLPTPQDMQVIAQNQAKTAQDLPAHPQTTEGENPFQQLGDIIRNIAHPQAEASSAPSPLQDNYPKAEWYQGFKPMTPPDNVAAAIKNAFGEKDAPLATLLAATENAGYNSNVPDNVNSNNKGVDRGVFQINSQSFDGLMQRRGAEMAKLGIHNYDDMRDPVKNAQVAKMIYDEGGVGRWFGWQHKGYDLMNGHYTAPDITTGH